MVVGVVVEKAGMADVAFLSSMSAWRVWWCSAPGWRAARAAVLAKRKQASGGEPDW